jgi:hypothetical protein
MVTIPRLRFVGAKGEESTGGGGMLFDSMPLYLMHLPCLKRMFCITFAAYWSDSFLAFDERGMGSADDEISGQGCGAD